MENQPKNIIQSQLLCKTYKRGSEEIKAVDNVNLTIHEGELASFVGPSGSGKTSLINLLGCLDNPTSGKLMIDGQDIFGQRCILSETELTKTRRQLFGYIFQKFYLIPTLTVFENVILPMAFYQKPGSFEKVIDILKLLGIENRQHHLPGEISGGEMQRVAIARALVNNPRILLADEPTGNLDTKRSEEIGEIFQTLNKAKNITIIMVTHNSALAKISHHIFEIHDGKIK